MKKLLISFVALFLLFSVQASAQVKFGVTGGMNFNTSKFNEIDVKANAGWNAGVSLLIDLPLGFSLQPSLIYNQKGANLAEGVSHESGYVELPVSLQWGPDLIAFRPFIDATPFVGYAVSNKTEFSSMLGDITANTDSFDDAKQKMAYGFGVGAGVNLWKFQVVARYFWNFGSLYNVESWDDVKENMSHLDAESANFGGIMINLAFFF